VDENKLRLWSLHPSYLDSTGLNAVWREGLLAQAVLLGRTTARRNHSQLHRFQNHEKPASAIGFYLLKILEEASSRGYHYKRVKIAFPAENIKHIEGTRGQLCYEWDTLMMRQKTRNSRKSEEVVTLKQREIVPTPYPFFVGIEGEAEPWEKLHQKI